MNWHYVKHNQTTRLPRRHVFLDTEARERRVPGGIEQVWRVGAAIFRHAPKKGKCREWTNTYLDPSELWADVENFTPDRSRTVLWTHNLGYDLRISKALSALPGRGWSLVAQNLTPGSTWMVWRRGGRSLTMVDSASVFPTTVAQLAKSFDTDKLPLPSQVDSDDRWLQRCLRDVQILRLAVVSYLDRLESEDLGNWQLTGTGQAWAAFRHRFLTHDMLVHWDEDARAAERRAMWTGRCEAYWHGRATHVRIDEWDMTLAYPRIAIDGHVPIALAAAFVGDADLHRWMRWDGYTVLAEVEITTTKPLVPMEREGRICWPVGSFRSTLWQPELSLLQAHGAQIRTIRGWAYKSAPALAQWAQWIVGELGAPDAVSPAWWKTVCKHWARALIGRMAMTYREWEYIGRLPYVDIRRGPYMDADTGESGEVMQIGHELFLATQVVEWGEAMPMITGWIQSQCRANLAELLIAAGDRTALYVDTDSLLVSGEHYDRMAAIAAARPELGLRVKRSWESVEIKGPRQLITGRRVRVAGVSVKAERLPDGTLRGEVWQSLASAVTARRATSVRITPRRWHLRATDARRVAGVDGWTNPIQVGAVEALEAA